jgi:hypothetical protein
MNNPLATYLKEKKAAADGSIFEIFVVDNKGLNVAQTDPTLDYMQGDEAKFRNVRKEAPRWLPAILPSRSWCGRS